VENSLAAAKKIRSETPPAERGLGNECGRVLGFEKIGGHEPFKNKGKLIE